MKISGRLLFENTRKKFKLNLVFGVVLVIESNGLYFLSSLLLQWNSVNTDTKGTCLSVRIIWVFRIKRALRKKTVTDTFSIILRLKQTFLRDVV